MFSTIRASAFGAALYPQVGLPFRNSVRRLCSRLDRWLRTSAACGRQLDYSASRRPRYSPVLIWATLLRTVGYMAAALLCSTLVRHLEHPWLFALRLGVVTGLVTGWEWRSVRTSNTTPTICRSGAWGWLGSALMFCGFALQSLQYWLAVFDVRVT